MSHKRELSIPNKIDGNWISYDELMQNEIDHIMAQQAKPYVEANLYSNHINDQIRAMKVIEKYRMYEYMPNLEQCVTAREASEAVRYSAREILDNLRLQKQTDLKQQYNLHATNLTPFTSKALNFIVQNLCLRPLYAFFLATPAHELGHIIGGAMDNILQKTYVTKRMSATFKGIFWSGNIARYDKELPDALAAQGGVIGNMVMVFTTAMFMAFTESILHYSRLGTSVSPVSFQGFITGVFLMNALALATEVIVSFANKGDLAQPDGKNVFNNAVKKVLKSIERLAPVIAALMLMPELVWSAGVGEYFKNDMWIFAVPVITAVAFFIIKTINDIIKMIRGTYEAWHHFEVPDNTYTEDANWFSKEKIMSEEDAITKIREYARMRNAHSILPYLTDVRSSVASYAANALGFIGTSKQGANLGLLFALNDKRLSVRLAAQDALARIYKLAWIRMFNKVDFDEYFAAYDGNIEDLLHDNDEMKRLHAWEWLRRNQPQRYEALRTLNNKGVYKEFYLPSADYVEYDKWIKKARASNGTTVLNGDVSLAIVVQKLTDIDPAIRWHAWQWLRQYVPQEYIRLKAFNDGDYFTEPYLPPLENEPVEVEHSTMEVDYSYDTLTNDTNQELYTALNEAIKNVKKIFSQVPNGHTHDYEFVSFWGGLRTLGTYSSRRTTLSPAAVNLNKVGEDVLLQATLVHEHVHHLLRNMNYSKPIRELIAAVIEMRYLFVESYQLDKKKNLSIGTTFNEVVAYVEAHVEIAAPLKHLLNGFRRVEGSSLAKQIQVVWQFLELEKEMHMGEETLTDVLGKIHRFYTHHFDGVV